MDEYISREGIIEDLEEEIAIGETIRILSRYRGKNDACMVDILNAENVLNIFEEEE